LVATANRAGHYRRDGCLVVNDGGGIIWPQMADFRGAKAISLAAGPAEMTTFAGPLNILPHLPLNHPPHRHTLPKVEILPGSPPNKPHLLISIT